MEKKITFSLIFIFMGIFSSLFANAGPWGPAPTDLCDAPAPTNFHLSSRTANSAIIEWIPAWFDASQTISVYKKDITAEWTLVNTYQNIGGTSATIGDISPENEYRLTISTHCLSGENSSIEAELFLDKIIVELVIGGRMPVEPKVLSYCDAIEYTNYPWVGFRVRKIGSTDPLETNLFELQVTQTPGTTKYSIKRVFNTTVIYAISNENLFPGLPLVVLNPFLIGKKLANNSFHLIGRVSITDYNPMPIVGICKDIILNNPPWDESYVYEVLVSNVALPTLPGSPMSGRVGRGGVSIVNSIFSDFIEFTCPVSPEEQGTASLIDVNGRQVLESKFDRLDGKVIIQTNTILPGIYFLTLRAGTEYLTSKVIKL